MPPSFLIPNASLFKQYYQKKKKSRKILIYTKIMVNTYYFKA